MLTASFYVQIVVAGGRRMCGSCLTSHQR